ncbi:hypothetical protein HK102_012160 [Quaeritorhiza haematococci]|nr:hypothetical protein HK102_012160 [Quaeritorhiza haematococci]
MSYRVLIVGGVAGGATAAARLRRQNEQASITVFERGPYVSFANCGLPYYVGNVIQEESDLLLATPQLFRSRFNIDVQLHSEVTKINRAEKSIVVKNVETGAERTEKYDYLVLSTGAAPIKPPLEGVNLDGIFTLRNIPDSVAMRDWIEKKNVKHAVVVGGGFIGLEMTENLVHRGIKVEVIQNLNQVMTPFDPEMVTEVHKHMKEKGVVLHLGTMVNGFGKSEDGKLVVKTSSNETYKTDMVILSIGVRPEAGLAKEAGLELGALGGIRTNEKMQTSDPHIYAVGDSVETKDYVTGQWVIIPLANPANRQGRVAADHIANPHTPARYRGVQGTAVCQIFDYVLACTGSSEKILQRFQKPYEKVYVHPFNHVSYYPNAKRINIKVLFDPKDGRVLGAQAIGLVGVEKRIDVISMAIQGGLTVYDLEEVELCYAPQFGAAKDPINLAGMVASNALRGEQPLAHWNDPKVNPQSSPQLVDVRTNDEFKNGHVPNAIHIPLNDLRTRMNELDKAKPVHIYCAIGQRGYYATRLLRQHGYDAINVSGGFTTFKNVNPVL